MLESVKAFLPITAVQASRFQQKPVAVLIALAAIAALALFVIRSLRGRVQSSPSARQFYQEGLAEQKKGHKAAIDKFTEALNRNPDPVLGSLIRSSRAISYRALGQLDDALRDLEVVIACEGIKSALRVTAHISKGEMHAERNEHNQAVQHYDAALKLNPVGHENNPYILLRIGFSKTILKDFQGAIDALTQGYDLKPADLDCQADILTQRAEAYMGLNKLVDALSDLEAALKCNPQDVDVLRGIHISMGMIHDADKAFIKAIQAYTVALDCNPSPDERIDILFKRAASKLAAKQLDDAIADLDEAWDCNPEDPNVRAAIRFQRGKIYLQLKKFREAIDDFTVAMSLVPDKCAARAEFLIHRGLAKENNSKEAAMEDWEEGFGCELDDGLVKAELHYLTCEVYFERKEYQKVIDNTTAALEYEFDRKELERDLYRLRARAHRRAGHLEDAIADWNMTLSFEFKYPDERASILFARGIAHQENGKIDQARQDCEDALKIVESEDLQQSIQDRLKSMNASSSSLSSSISSMIGSVLLNIPGSPFSSPKKK